MARTPLPNGCSCSSLSVLPKNWNQPDAPLKTLWQIRYRFYDPGHASRYPAGKQVRITGINESGSLVDRRKVVRELIKNELEKLTRFSYNPITESTADPEETGDYIIHPSTPFADALVKATGRLQCSENTKKHVARAVAYVTGAAKLLRIETMAISAIRKRHIKMILEKVPLVKGGIEKGKGSGPKGPWTSSSFNHYRSYLLMLFNELQDVEAVELDPVSKIKKMKGVARMRETLSTDQRREVNIFLHTNHYSFWRFMQVFFHSGARMSELARVKKEDVDLAGQRYKIEIRKGRETKEVFKTIKDLALPLWQEVVASAQTHQFLFSRNLVPGNKEINPRQITKRWRLLVKKPMGVIADFYSLKHSHSSEVVDMLSTKDAAAHNSHANESMVARVYDIRRADRQHDRVKGLNNPL